MPVTYQPDLNTVADIVKMAMKCSDKQANEYESEICKTPGNKAKLLAACGLSTAMIGYGGKLIVAGAATGGSTSVAGVALGAAGLLGVKRFCSAAIKLGKDGSQ